MFVEGQIVQYHDNIGMIDYIDINNSYIVVKLPSADLGKSPRLVVYPQCYHEVQHLKSKMNNQQFTKDQLKLIEESLISTQSKMVVGSKWYREYEDILKKIKSNPDK